MSKVSRACELVNKLYRLQEEILTSCDTVCQKALQGEPQALDEATQRLEEKVGHANLLHTCSNDAMKQLQFSKQDTL